MSVIEKSLQNSSFAVSNEITLLNAESDVARAKASRGISLSLMARLGLSKTDSKLKRVYNNPLDQEVVGLAFSIPIFDWGLGYGRVQKAKAAQEASKAKVQQSENDYRRKIFMAVGQFNNQRQQCLASKKAQALALERYNLMVEKFRSGKATVTELIDSQSEKDAAIQKYITDISNFWIYYYGIRQLTLYDYINNRDITADFNQFLN
jgi:outer membrane protein TolC